MATSVGDRKKTNVKSFIYIYGSTISANWVSIGQVDVQITGLTESLKCKKKQEHFITHASSAAGWAK